MHLRALFLATISLLVIGCGGGNEFPPLPEGVQILTGSLVPAEISLLRRGTHVLVVEGLDKYYVESSSINLRRYEQKKLVMEGELTHNVDPEFLPVLEVSKVIEVLEENMKSWELRSLGLMLEMPETWNGRVKDGEASFQPPNSSHNAITIIRMMSATGTGTVIEEGEEDTSIGLSASDSPLGTPIVVGKKRAIRIFYEETGNQEVIVERIGHSIIFSLNMEEFDQPELLRETWLAMLNSVVFDEDKPDDTYRQTGTGAGTPCGGPAGILCPTNFYCDVTHLEENIGICKRM